MNHVKPIRTVLIDDEAEARDVLATLLAVHPDIRVVATAADAVSGLEQIRLHDPDLIFLDIQMPGRTGLQLVDDIRKMKMETAIVFITAFDQFAIGAFKVFAFDYLLKPVDPEILADTLNRYRQRQTDHDYKNSLDALLINLNENDRIRIATRSGFLLLNPSEIMCATADGNYTEVRISASETELITMTLSVLLEILPPEKFLRISRSQFVNKTMIYKVDRKKRICEIRKGSDVLHLGISKYHLRDLG